VNSADIPDAILVNGRDAGSHRAGAAMPLALTALDRGVHYGDGLFETIACREGVASLLDAHLQRLTDGCARLNISFDAGADLRREIRHLAGDRRRALIKVIVTRGDATARGYRPQGTERATRIVLRYGWPADGADEGGVQQGVACRIASLRLGENPALAGLKHLNRLELVLARSEWSEPSIFEALLFSSSGSLISGTMSNVFLVRERRLSTPLLDGCGVAGVMRALTLRLAASARLSAQERRLDVSDLEQAEEIFLTNARIGIVPVRTLEDRELKPGPVTRELQGLLRPHLGESASA